MPISSFPYIRTRKAAEVENFVSSVLGARNIIIPQPDELSLKADYYQTPQLSLWFCSYGAAIKKEYDASTYVRLQLPHKGAACTTFSTGKQVFINRRQACISDGKALLEFGPGYEQLALRINKSLLNKKVGALLHRDAVHEIQFDAALDIQENSLLQKNFRFFLELVNLSKTVPVNPLLLQEIEQAVLVAMLCEAQHNYSDFLEKPSAPIAPWQVRAVQDFIQANWNKAVTIEEISRVTHVSVRSIFRTFKDVHGMTPMGYVKKVRLENARMLLQSRDNKYAVAQVAAMCGFATASHFSREYLRAHGESPSHTFRFKK